MASDHRKVHLTTVDAKRETPRGGESRGMIGLVHRAVSWAIRLAVWSYRAALAPLLGGHCRYVPTCSQYLLEAVEKYGPWRGLWKGVWRIARCHPWGPSGFDPP